MRMHIDCRETDAFIRNLLDKMTGKTDAELDQFQRDEAAAGRHGNAAVIGDPKIRKLLIAR